jgi:hypothetical protein
MSDKLYEELEKTKLEKSVGETFASEVNRLSKDQLEARLLQLAKYEQVIITSKKNDEELMTAREHIKELNARLQ